MPSSSNEPAPLLPFDARTRRVLELREAIHNGTYRPDPREVAAALLRHWADTAVEAAPVAPSADDFNPARFLVAASSEPSAPSRSAAAG
ncbi:flagellar biosynthesis anti-sigma factor FlgM [Tepidiforma sp.]|uniref:flagellar biosynthesis anti-sigma factor FlgM n=1 Tax=Tepidiforma sp. TaxID=2682230 RepID=UPI002ADDC8ED|nr:flagellar biosynthesis anti-sigma factor FlgM [Tepidiforma sp.]